MSSYRYNDIPVDYTVVDVREHFEYLSGYIPDSVNRPLSSLTKSDLPEGGIVFVCQNERRSTDAVTLLHHIGRDGDYYTLAGGLTGYVEDGFLLRREDGHIPVMQQTQMVIGSILMLAAVLDLPLVSFIMGAGLFYAGKTGTCGMASILKRMPWNK